MSNEKLTPEQIQNWRKVLCGMVGAYALIMPDSEIQAFRDKLQGGLTPRAVDEGDSAPLQAESTPEVLSIEEAGTTPALRN